MRNFPYIEPRRGLKEGAYPIHGESNIIFPVDMGAKDVKRALRQRIIYMKIPIPHLPSTTAPLRHMHPLRFYDSSGKLTVYTPSQDVFDTERTSAGFSDFP